MTRKRVRGLVATAVSLFVLGIVLTGCGDKVDAEAPPSIRYGETSCGRCHMMISDERFAAGVVDSSGKAIVVDDVGELVVMIQEEGLNDRRVWVHDYETREWIDGTKAFFVDTHEVITPMAMGIIAFTHEDNARRFAAEHNGNMHTWSSLLSDWKMHEHPHK